MNDRARNEAIKNVVTLVAGVRRSDVRCNLKRGGWATITTPTVLAAEKCEAIEKELLARGLVNTYGDPNAGDVVEPCVSFWSGK